MLVLPVNDAVQVIFFDANGIVDATVARVDADFSGKTSQTFQSR